MDISNIPYADRKTAADLLISKAKRLAELPYLHFNEISDKDFRKVQKAISLYDIALGLMKPHDPNYQTIINWKCLTLIEIGQFEEACKWYEELVRSAVESQGPNVKDPTRDFAKEQLKRYKSKKNLPIKELDQSEMDIFDDPSFCLWAEGFCNELQNNKFKKAHQYFSPELAREIPLKKLKENWLQLLDGSDSNIDIHLEAHRVGTEQDKDTFVGWCYFVVANNEINEAISFDIYQTEGHGFEIRGIEFGRP